MCVLVNMFNCIVSKSNCPSCPRKDWPNASPLCRIGSWGLQSELLLPKIPETFHEATWGSYTCVRQIDTEGAERQRSNLDFDNRLDASGYRCS